MVEVDNQLPLAPPKSGKATTTTSGNNGEYVFKYAKSVDSQLWAPLLEKAYAKIHGSYKAISGGWIAEALFDLTGWPTESISFNGHIFDSEQVNGPHPANSQTLPRAHAPTRQRAHAPTRPRAHAPTHQRANHRLFATDEFITPGIPPHPTPYSAGPECYRFATRTF